MIGITRGISSAVLTTLLLLTIGCAPERVNFGDTIDLDFDWNPVANNQEAMHQPYLLGSDFRIRVHSRWIDEDMTNWTLEVADPSILELGGPEVMETSEPGVPEQIYVDAVAVGEGTTTLEVYGKSGQFITSTPVVVAVPDNAVLKPNGPLCVHQEELIVDDNEFQVLRDGLSTYMVEWYKGDERLYGNGSVSASTADDIYIETLESHWFEDRDWLQVEPFSLGDHVVTLYSGDVAVQDVTFETVTADDVGHIVLHGQETVLADEGDSYTVLAQAYDFVGRPIYGIEFEWALSDDEEDGLGDLYRYEFDPDDDNLLEAFFGSHTDSLTIHGEGYVDSSNEVGCAVGGPSNRATAAGAAILVGLLGLLRIRRSH